FFSPAAATSETSTLSLHDALPIWARARDCAPAPAFRPEERNNPFRRRHRAQQAHQPSDLQAWKAPGMKNLAEDPVFRLGPVPTRSEEHTSELQSRENLVCRLLLEK